MNILRFAFTVRHTLGRAWALAQDPHVPRNLKITALALALLILSPLNILGDIPLIGVFDDVALLGFLLRWFVKAAEQAQARRDIEITARTGRDGFVRRSS
jgi:uncharacterized membrane protein YkvA (DUF1232 family)